MTTLGSKIQTIRKQLRLNQEGLAEKIGVTRQTVGVWENNQKIPGGENLKRLSDVLGVTTDYLMGRTDDPAPEDIKKEAPSQTAESLKENHLDNLESNLESRPLKTVMIPVYAESEICCGKGFAYSSDCSTDVTPSRRIPFVLPPVGQGANGKVVGVIARGNSMINAGIRDGATVCIAYESEIYDRQPAAVCVGPEQRFLLRCVIHKPDGSIILRAKNPDYPDEIITAEDLEAGWYREIGPVVGIFSLPEWA